MSNPLQPLQEPKVEADLTKKILRGINDTVRLLDDVRGRAQIVSHLFTPSVRVLRSKLHELCSRYIWSDPANNGKRGEETLWRKAYHDVFVTAKRLRQKGDSWDDEESALVHGILLSGIGYYQHLIFRLQSDNTLHIDGIADFSMNIPDIGLEKGKTSWGRADEAPWADEMASRCLLNMGDLWRYMRDVEPGWDVRVAERHYTQAAWLAPGDGRPYNQLATLAAATNYSLDAVYYYMRSVCCAIPFPGAEGNLNRILEKNLSSLELEPLGPPPSPAQRTIARFLLLVDVWFNGKQIDNVQLYCSEVLHGFQQLIQRVEGSKTNGKVTDPKCLFMTTEPTTSIPSAVILEMCAVLFMCWRKIQTSECNSEGTSLIATILAIVDTIAQQVIARWEVSKVTQKKIRARRRRRRRDSDASASDASSSAEDGPDDDLDSGDSPLVSSCDEEEPGTNGHVPTSGKNAWIGDELIPVLSVICCWLSNNNEIVAKCQNSAKPIAGNLVVIMNKVAAYVSGSSSRKKIKDSKMPLPEDARLRGTPGLETHASSLEWSLLDRRLTRQEEVALRAHRLLAFAENLPGIHVDNNTRVFHCVDEITAQTPPPPKEECKGKLMKNMGQLWLKAEVKELENRIKKVNGADYSPYLAVDVEALTEHILLIKQIVGSRQFIVVIPTVVISQLDECKKTSGKARETIRWLESQFLHGNRNLRSQKVQERVSLGVIKYPKKKDKDAWNFFQMMECCAYLSKQSELRSKAGATVTFLTGSKEKTTADIKQQTNGQDFSPSGLAATFGVTLEHVETFHSKWKLSCKSHG